MVFLVIVHILIQTVSYSIQTHLSPATMAEYKSTYMDVLCSEFVKSEYKTGLRFDQLWLHGLKVFWREFESLLI